MQPSWGILEQTSISQGKGVEMQASSKKASRVRQSRQGLVSLQSTDWDIWIYSLVRVMYCAFHTHAHTVSIHYHVASGTENNVYV